MMIEIGKANRRRILIAEDDTVLLEMLSDKFTRYGFDVFCAKDGQTARNLIWQNYPDVVILDWLMPKEDGLSLCRMIKSDPRLAATKVIVLTARGRKKEVAAARAVSPDLLLIKPVSLRSLLEHVQMLSKDVDGVKNA